MILEGVHCQPMGIYQHAETLRRCRRVELSHTLAWVTLAFKTLRSPCALLCVDLETKQARELRDFLNEFLEEVVVVTKEVRP